MTITESIEAERDALRVELAEAEKVIEKLREQLLELASVVIDAAKEAQHQEARIG